MWDRVLSALAESSSASGGEPSEATSKLQELEVPLAVLILLLYIVLGHNLELWKDAHKSEEAETEPQNRAFLCTFHESGPAILLGLAVGLMMKYGERGQFDFQSDVFFYVVLPPIIFHQGYALKKRNFFKYFHYIFSFGFLGTGVQFVVITMVAHYSSQVSLLNIVQYDGVSIGLTLHECMLIAAVFSAADEVATLSLIKQNEYPKLSAVLFGEGVLNDAMSILLFHTVRSSDEGVADPGADSSTTVSDQDLPLDSSADTGASAGAGIMPLVLFLQACYVLVTAGAVGMGSGLLISRLLKKLDTLQQSPVRQTAILMLGGYLSFSLSEALDLSGILAVFFCGLTLSHYAWHSLGPEAQVASKITSDTISMIAEAYCFAAIGLSVHEFDASQWCWGFIAIMVAAVMVARAISVYGICLVGWFISPGSFSLPHDEQHVLFFGGLVRGAITWAQVVQIKSNSHTGLLVTTSLGVILFTTVFFGTVMPFFTRTLTPEVEHLPASNSAFQYILPGDKSSSHNGTSSVADDPTLSIMSSVGNKKTMRGYVHRAWKKFDGKYMKPLFGGSGGRLGGGLDYRNADDDFSPTTHRSAHGREHLFALSEASSVEGDPRDAQALSDYGSVRGGGSVRGHSRGVPGPA